MSGDWITDPDYVIRPPQVNRLLAHGIGAASLVVLLSGILVLTSRTASGRWRACSWGVFGSVAVGLAYAGLAAHIVTAPVVGANIGAVLVVVAGLPVALVVLTVGIRALRVCLRPC